MAAAPYPWQEELSRRLYSLRESLPNGILIYGPAGIGTFELANAFAGSLLCESPNGDGSACGRCAGCSLVRAGTHPDIRYILSEVEAVKRGLPYDPPSGSSTARKNLYRDILIHQPRSLSDFLSLSSHRRGRRVVVVYPADRIKPDAASVFLKMLEEPPEGLVFILVVNDIDMVLPAIRSRCRLIRAVPPSSEEAASWLSSQGVRDPEKALAEAGGMPLLVVDKERETNIPQEIHDALLKFLSRGAFPGAGSFVIGLVGKDWTIAPVALLLQKWGVDLALAKEALPPHYFVGEADVLSRLAGKISRGALEKWSRDMSSLRRVAGHTINAKMALEQALFSYLGMFR